MKKTLLLIPLFLVGCGTIQPGYTPSTEKIISDIQYCEDNGYAYTAKTVIGGKILSIKCINN